MSFNTIEFTALLLWSLHRVLDDDVEVVVVDNGSSDGSGRLLAEASEAGLCRLLANDENTHHGPALNQAMGELVEQPTPPRYVWILDSDVVIRRGDVLREALAVAGSGAAIVGERHWDPWHEMHRLELYSLLIDPMQIWHPGAPTFRDDGDPSFELLAAAQQAGLAAENFPFAADGYLIHRGRASLAGVVTSDDRSHPLYEWALEHHAPHFGGIPGARERYESILTRFRSEVGALDGPSLIAACESPPT
ncbi:MAG TPA: glycosyltransferase [Acidimicrobiales bacterium]|nr:glycosyltransferase [Acidimicrobiales bacterium]